MNDIKLIPITQPKLVNTYTTGPQFLNDIAFLNNDHFVVTWTDQLVIDWDQNPISGQDGSGTGVYAQMYNASGSTIGSEFRVNTFTYGDQSSSKIAPLKDGGFIVTWTDGSWSMNKYTNGQDGSLGGIYAQRYNSNGDKVDSEFRINTTTQGFQGAPSIAGLDGGGFVVTWMSYGQDGSQEGVYAQIYGTEGSKIGAEFQVNSYTPADQAYPSICALNNGGFVINWQDEPEYHPHGDGTSAGQDGSGLGVRAQIYDASGGKVGAEFQVNTYSQYDQNGALIAKLKSGFIATWNDWSRAGGNTSDGNGVGVYAQIFDNQGGKIGNEFRVNTEINGDQSLQGVVVLPGDDILISYYDAIRKHSYGQIYDSKGVLKNSDVDLGEHGAYVKNDANGHLVVGWTALNNATPPDYDVYTQLYSAIGCASSNNTYDTSTQKIVDKNSTCADPAVYGTYLKDSQQIAPITDLAQWCSSKGVSVFNPNTESKYQVATQQVIGKDQPFGQIGERCTKSSNIYDPAVSKLIDISLPVCTVTQVCVTPPYTPSSNLACSKNASEIVNINYTKIVYVELKAEVIINPVYDFTLIQGGNGKQDSFKIISSPGSTVIKGFNKEQNKIDLTLFKDINFEKLSLISSQGKRVLSNDSSNVTKIKLNDTEIILEDVDGLTKEDFIFSNSSIVKDRPSTAENQQSLWSPLTIASLAVAGAEFIGILLLSYKYYKLTNAQSCKANYELPTMKSSGTKLPIGILLEENRDIDLVSLEYSKIYFNYDTQLVKTSWVGSKDAILVYDYNQNNKVDSGLEIVMTSLSPNSKSDFEALLNAFDSNHDHIFSAQDTEFDKFLLWQDYNQNGISEDHELKSLKEAGLISIDFNHQAQANQEMQVLGILNTADVYWADGRTTQAYDLVFYHE